MADALSGLTSTVFTDRPPHVRITWIAWNSPFRATDLQLGDRIIAVNGAPVSDETILKASSSLPGCYGETAAFAAAGLDVGSPLTLTVRRRALPQGWTEMTITAPVAAPTPTTRTPDGRSLVAPDGPDIYDNAGFNNGGWAAWYQALVTLFTKLADADRIHGGSFNTRFEHRNLAEQHGARVDFAVANFPCDWSRILKIDYDAARAAMAGEPATLPHGGLDFRRRGEELAGQIKGLSTAAWNGAIAAHTIIPSAPAPNPAADDVSLLAGKMLVLPPLGNSHYLSDGGRNWFAAGSRSDGWWFIDAETPATIAMLRAQRRYARLVNPDLRAEWQFLGRVTPDVRLCAIGDRAYFGLVVEPVAALVGGTMFVDLTAIDGGETAFAGEAGLFDDTPDLPSDDASPAAVVAAVIAAVKAGDLALWSALHAAWFTDYRADDAGVMHAVLIPYGRKPTPDRFEDQRRLLKERCCDARPVWTDEPFALIPAGRYEGAPAIEQVAVWVNHIGDFSADSGAPMGHDYRSYIDVMVRQTWVLQRIGSGPWRVDDAGRI
jgi:hypothetical protein